MDLLGSFSRHVGKIRDLIDDIHAFFNLAKGGILLIEKSCIANADEELTRR